MFMQYDAYDYILIDPCDVPILDDGWTELHTPADFLEQQQKALDWFAIPVEATLFNQREVLSTLRPYLGKLFLLSEPTAPDEDYTYMLVDDLFMFDQLNLFH